MILQLSSKFSVIIVLLHASNVKKSWGKKVFYNFSWHKIGQLKLCILMLIYYCWKYLAANVLDIATVAKT